MEISSAELMARYRAGDEDAATAIFERYVERLTRLARSRLSARLAARTDPEDVVQSAYRSFFVAARRGQFTLKRSGDLWRLLVSITLHKLCRGVQRHVAQRRSVDAEHRVEGTRGLEELAVSPEATPEEAAALADEMRAVMSALDGLGRRVLELRLQGEQIAEIAADTGRSERTVRRTLAAIRELLTSRLGAADG